MAKQPTRTIPIESIVPDPDLYPRSAPSEFWIARLASHLDAGVVFPPLVIEAQTNRLVDGWHRYRAMIKRSRKTAEVIEKTYASEADLLADAVRLNIGHGQPLDAFAIRKSVARLLELGYEKEKITEVIRATPDRLEKIIRGFASDENGNNIPLKGGILHMKQTVLDDEQQRVNKSYAGAKGQFYCRHLLDLLNARLWPPTQQFSDAMDALVDRWLEIRRSRRASDLRAAQAAVDQDARPSA